jgi:hypothetical protein
MLILNGWQFYNKSDLLVCFFLLLLTIINLRVKAKLIRQNKKLEELLQKDLTSVK